MAIPSIIHVPDKEHMTLKRRYKKISYKHVKISTSIECLYLDTNRIPSCREKLAVLNCCILALPEFSPASHEFHFIKARK